LTDKVMRESSELRHSSKLNHK